MKIYLAESKNNLLSISYETSTVLETGLGGKQERMRHGLRPERAYR